MSPSASAPPSAIFGLHRQLTAALSAGRVWADAAPAFRRGSARSAPTILHCCGPITSADRRRTSARQKAAPYRNDQVKDGPGSIPTACRRSPGRPSSTALRRRLRRVALGQRGARGWPRHGQRRAGCRRRPGAADEVPRPQRVTGVMPSERDRVVIEREPTQTDGTPDRR
jgi:hypothetical protein